MTRQAELFRLAETWRWRLAVYSYDYADPERLAALIRVEAIPPEYLGVVADIVAGQRLPNRKAAAKQKILIEDRVKYAPGIGFFKDFHGLFLSSGNVQETADRVGNQTAGAVRQSLQATRRKQVEHMVKALGPGITERNVNEFMREIQDLIDRWPSM